MKNAICLFLLSLLVSAPLRPQVTVHAEVTELARFVESHCLDCHTGKDAEAGFDLESLPQRFNDAAVYDHWVEVFDRVQQGEMPPDDALHKAEAEPFLVTLKASLIEADHRRIAESGRATVRRLNRFEYENSLRELLHAPWLQVASDLPADSTSNLFNKSGESLDVSHVQLTKYLEVGEYSLRTAINAAAHRPDKRRYYAREEPVILRYLRWRPGLQTSATRATIPLLGTEPQPEVIRGNQPLTVGNEDPMAREREAMGVVSGTFAATTKYDFTRMDLPIDGHYIVRMKTYTFLAGPNGASGGNDHGLTGGRKAWWRPSRTVAFPGRRSEPVTLYALADSGSTRWLTTFDSHPDAKIIEHTVALKQGETIRPDASRLVRTRPGWSGNPNATPAGVPGFAMNWLELEGPVTNQWPPASYRALFGEMPFEVHDGEVRVLSHHPADDARRLVADFARRALRGRAPQRESLDLFMAVYHEARDLGNDFTDATLAAFNAVLCSPEFLYLHQTPGELAPPALATRLAMFLWNGPPDKELLTALNARPDAATLTCQTSRLLEDSRSHRFAEAFLDYWLELRHLNDTVPDATLYPEYYLDTMLVESALLETRMFFRALIADNLPARNLVDSDFTFVNERLARHYGLPAEQSVALKRVVIPEDSPYGGFSTQASVMKVTANGTTTSPVLRGVWVVERLLGREIAEPPSGVEAIEPDTRGATTIGEQLAKHTKTQSCAACHRKFDPVGFALESFDVMGGWQQKYRALGDIGEPVQGYGKNGHAFEYRLAQPVECHSQLASGEQFKDIHQLKALLLKDERAIARNLVNQLVVYATGEPVSFADREVVEQILDNAKPSEYGVRDLIHGVIQSNLFRRK